MSDTKHTPEPWEYFEEIHEAGKLRIYCSVARKAGGKSPEDHILRISGEDAESTVRRIVACVNACKLYTNDELEYGMIEKEREAVMAWERAMMAAIGEDGLKSVSEAIAKLKAERDALLAERDKLLFHESQLIESLKSYINKYGPGYSCTDTLAYDNATGVLAAIDKAGRTT